MAELSFEQKVQGLQNYYRNLQELDPVNPGRNEVANPGFFYYADGHNASQPLQAVMKGVAFDLECHGRVEYGRRGLTAKDLREDTDELRAERADVLAVMTAPLSVEAREQRAERIATVLGDIVSGQPLTLSEYNGGLRGLDDAPEEITVDISRALFGVFLNGHVSDRVLAIKYDTPVEFGETITGESIMNIDVPALFRSPRNNN